MGKEKCRVCVHHKMQYSYLLKANIEYCDATDNGEHCKNSYKKKQKKETAKAFIKRAVSNETTN